MNRIPSSARLEIHRSNGRYIYTDYGKDGEMLYDLQKDPQENLNISGNLELSETLTKMKNHLADSQAEANRVSP